MIQRKTLRIRRILVAVRDVHEAPRSQLRKAATLARGLGARVELFHAINEPIASEVIRRGGPASQSRAQMVQAAERESQRRLEKLAAGPLFEGVKVQAITSWDYPPHEAIVRRVLASKADLVIAATQTRGLGARLVLTNTDWELIRQCPCALLLTKSVRDYRTPAVIAAVDPFHTHAKPARLDSRIIEAGAGIASALGGSLHAFHAYMPMSVIAPAPAGQPLAIVLPPDLEEAHSKRIAAAFDRLAKDAGIAPARRHLHMGDVANELEALVRRTRAGLVVMGAVSRSGLRRIFIGSTAESVLDKLSCDLLVVKPRTFVSSVPKRQAALWPIE